MSNKKFPVGSIVKCIASDPSIMLFRGELYIVRGYANTDESLAIVQGVYDTRYQHIDNFESLES